MSPNGTTPPKTTLFCPACSYRSPPDGWQTVDANDATSYRCPGCGTEVTRRPDVTHDGGQFGPETFVVTY